MTTASVLPRKNLATQRDWTGLTVAGIGSQVSCDDGIGLTLVRALSERPLLSGITARLWEDADALTLAHLLLESEQPVLLVDCADMRLDSGCWRLFSDANAGLNMQSRTLSTHGLGLAEALSIARTLGLAQPVHIFGIQPFDLAPICELSPEMKQRLPRLLRALEGAVVSLTSGFGGEHAPNSKQIPNVRCGASEPIQ
jgi:hydrogenase maturation protease